MRGVRESLFLCICNSLPIKAMVLNIKEPGTHSCTFDHRREGFAILELGWIQRPQIRSRVSFQMCNLVVGCLRRLGRLARMHKLVSLTYLDCCNQTSFIAGNRAGCFFITLASSTPRCSSPSSRTPCLLRKRDRCALFQTSHSAERVL